MVASVTSNGIQPQIPASNIFQPGGTEEQKRSENSFRSASPFDANSINAPSSTSRTSASATPERANTVQLASDRSEDNGASSTRSNRGTTLDVTV